jgi:DNA-binding SARP family transcriptional activator
MIVLRALGTAEIDTGLKTLTPSQEIVFAAALYLILERAKRVSRSHLASLLWPRAPEKARAHRLRQTILQLRKLGITLRADRNVVQLAREDVSTDIDDLTQGVPTLSDKLHGLEFLPGYDPHFSESFHDWIDETRANVHSALTRMLLSEMKTARDSGNWIGVERISTHCLALDAYNEAAVLGRAEAYAMRGQKATAVSILDHYIQDLAPRNPTLALPATILRRRVVQHTPLGPNKRFVLNEPDFVGRQKEMAILTQLLNSARKGNGAGCLINGEPGIGKTRLSSELAKFAELQGVRVERVCCKRADTHQPLSSFVALVPALRDMPGALGCSQKSLLWLKRLTEFDNSSDELPTPSEDSGTLYTNLRSAVFDLLDAVSEEQCLLIIVEDIQWLDRASAKLLAAILEWMPAKKLFFLFNSRQRDNLLVESISPHQVATIDLKPLATREASTLIRTTINSSDGVHDANDLAWLVDTGDGNPYFLQELAKHWMETGQRDEVPPSVAMVLDERISRLSGVARQLLQACVVLGENSNIERLEQILGYTPNDLLTGIQELSAGGMLRSAPPKEVTTQKLLVRHDLLSIEVLNGLAPASVAFLHRRCGIILEREVLGTSISISLLRACAFHWYHSGDSGRAYRLAVKCANHLLEIGLAVDAAAAFEGALVFCSSVDAQIEVLGRIIQALRMARDWPALLRAIARFRTLQNAESADGHHDDLEIMEFEALRATETAIGSLFSRTLTCVYDNALPAAHRVRVAGVAVKLASGISDLQELRRLYFAVRPLLNDNAVDTRSRLQLEVVYNTMCGDLREALKLAKERVTFERTHGTSSLLTHAITDLAFVLRRTGPDEEILSVLLEAYDTAVEHKIFAAARDSAERIAAFLVDSRRPGAEEWMRRAVDRHGEGPELHITFSLNAYRTRIALRENRLWDAKTILERDFDWGWLQNRRGWLAAVIALRVRLRIAERARREEISPDVEELRELYEFTAPLGGQDYEIAGLCEGLLYAGRRADAEAYLEDYLSKKRRDLTQYSRELAEVSAILAPSQIESEALQRRLVAAP